MPESQNNFKICSRDKIKSPPHIHKKDISMDLSQDLIMQEQLIWLMSKYSSLLLAMFNYKELTLIFIPQPVLKDVKNKQQVYSCGFELALI